MTARATLEARLGRPLGPIATMPRDLRKAMLGLALQLQKTPRSTAPDYLAEILAKEPQ